MLSRLLRDLTSPRTWHASEPRPVIETILHGSQPSLQIPEVVESRVEGPVENLLADRAAAADTVVLIAPETKGRLAALARVVELSGGRLCSPSSDAIALAADKLALARRLGALGVPTVPWGVPLDPSGGGGPCVVVKPRDGAGCLDTLRVQADVCRDALDLLGIEATPAEWIVQPFWPGIAASVAVVRHRAGETFILPAVQQCITHTREQARAPLTDRSVEWIRLSYAGGRMPLARPLAARAVALARQVAARLPELTGYWGIDLILGRETTGRHDRVVEVNPRLTTSYLGYSEAFGPELARAIVGTELPTPLASRRDNPVTGVIQFDASGVVARQPEREGDSRDEVPPGSDSVP